MVKIYPNGLELYNDNKEMLLQNKYVEVFFRLDSPLLTEVNKKEYALKVFDDSSSLVVLMKEPYNMLFAGDPLLADEMVDYLLDNNYKIKDLFCVSSLAEALKNSFLNRGIHYELLIGMDFMECHKKVEVDSSLIEIPTEDDLDELYEMEIAFIKDCGLHDVADKNHLKEKLKDYRIIRKDGLIISMARIGAGSKDDKKVACVYTRDDYRGKGYARICVGTVLNEIIDSGYYATLNVDQKNPISYHLYSSLGFKKVFSQDVYELKL